MTEGKKLLERHIDDMWKCAHCSLCKYPPLANVRSARFSQVCCSMDYGLFHAWCGGGKLNMGLSILEERVESISEEMRDAVLQCTLCGACDTSCKYSTDMEVLEGIFDLRRYVVETIGPHPIHAKFAENAEKMNNPYGEPHEKRQDWIEETSVKEDKGSKILFFTGCTAAYRQQDMVQASVEILNSIDIPFQLAKEEHCCGSPIYRSGMVEKAKGFFKHTIDMFEELGIEEVITACPGCYAMFAAEYPGHLDKDTKEKWGKIKFRHMTEVIQEAIRKKKIQIKEDKTSYVVTYHDPCHLGRGAEPYIPEWEGTERKVFNQITIFEPPKEYRRGAKGVYDAPREIISKMSKNINFIEMFRIAESSYCCGSGGGVKAAYPEMARNTVSERLEEADYVLSKAIEDDNEFKDKVLLSACPFCKTNFEQGIKDSGKKIQYKDINQFVLEMMKK